MTAIIHEQEEVPLTTICGWRDRPIEIAVDELESVCRAILGYLRERQPPLLLGQAAVTQLAYMLDVGQSSDHLLF